MKVPFPEHKESTNDNYNAGTIIKRGVEWECIYLKVRMYAVDSEMSLISYRHVLEMNTIALFVSTHLGRHRI